jgi:hypothetical protein
MGRTVTDGGQSGPDWKVPAIRCGLEVTLLVLIVTYLYLHVRSTLLQGFLLVVGLAGSVAILMWYVNRLSLAWVRYARNLARQKRRQRERRREGGQCTRSPEAFGRSRACSCKQATLLFGPPIAVMPDPDPDHDAQPKRRTDPRFDNWPVTQYDAYSDYTVGSSHHVGQ